MKRFATYLYTYIDREKTENKGFIKVEINGMQIKLMIQINNDIEEKLCGEKDVFLILNKDNAVNLGKINLTPKGAKQFFEQNISSYMEENYMEENQNSDENKNELYGIKIGIGDDFLASCWTDDGEFVVSYTKNNTVKKHIPKVITAQEENETSVMDEKIQSLLSYEIKPEYKNPATKKIDLEDLKNYPAKNWYLSHNSFLLHGYATYNHLLIKRDKNGQNYLGVPAISEPAERIMAQIYGFDKFEHAVPTSEDEAESGVFGYFFCKLM